MDDTHSSAECASEGIRIQLRRNPINRNVPTDMHGTKIDSSCLKRQKGVTRPSSLTRTIRPMKQKIFGNASRNSLDVDSLKTKLSMNQVPSTRDKMLSSEMLENRRKERHL